MKAAIIATVAVIVVGGGGYLVFHKNSDKTNSQPNSSSSQSSNSNNASQPSSSDNQPVAATITYSSSGFSPSTVTVKAGDTIALKNTSSQDVQFDSDPHPAHTDDTELNVGIVSPGQTVNFKVMTTGSHGYHNHFNPGDTGTIVVQ